MCSGKSIINPSEKNTTFSQFNPLLPLDTFEMNFPLINLRKLNSSLVTFCDFIHPTHYDPDESEY